MMTLDDDMNAPKLDQAHLLKAMTTVKARTSATSHPAAIVMITGHGANRRGDSAGASAGSGFWVAIMAKPS